MNKGYFYFYLKIIQNTKKVNFSIKTYIFNYYQLNSEN